jgi:hypothetical protein
VRSSLGIAHEGLAGASPSACEGGVCVCAAARPPAIMQTIASIAI